MEMMNRAIEDVADFREMMQKLRDGATAQRAEVQCAASAPVATMPPKRPGENREQYRARVFGRSAA